MRSSMLGRPCACQGTPRSRTCRSLRFQAVLLALLRHARHATRSGSSHIHCAFNKIHELIDDLKSMTPTTGKVRARLVFLDDLQYDILIVRNRTTWTCRYSVMPITDKLQVVKYELLSDGAMIK